MPARMPAAFIGHGSPMNTLQDNPHTRRWQAFGQQAPRPDAILMISAHWYPDYCAVTAMPSPRTIHDFYGFPRELFEFSYPAPGQPALAQRIAGLLDPLPVQLDQQWGLDHGTWSVLAHVYPQADIPVVQLAIDASKPADWHLELGRKLAVLRDEGVMLMGSGNIVHHLGVINRSADAPPYPWAGEFDSAIRTALLQQNDELLTGHQQLGQCSALSVPTPEHYLPLLYIAGARQPGDTLRFFNEGIEMGSLSMTSFAFEA